MSLKKVLITGGCGFIGSHLVKSFEDSNDCVEVVDNLSSGKIKPSQSKLIENDFASPEVLDLIRSGEYKTIFHLAAKSSVPWSIENIEESHEENLSKTLKLAKACADSSTNFIFSSSSAVYGNTEELPTSELVFPNPSSPYALQKLTVENYCKLLKNLYGLRYVALRYFNVFGPGQIPSGAYPNVISSWLSLAVKNKFLDVFGDISKISRDFIYIDDVVSANILAENYISSSNNFNRKFVFNIGSGIGITLLEVFKLIEEEFGKNLQFITHPSRPGDVNFTQADISLAKTELGFYPNDNFKFSFKKTVDWYKEIYNGQ